MNNQNEFKEEFENKITEAKTYLKRINFLLNELELVKKNTDNALNYSLLKKFTLFISTIYLSSTLILIYYQNTQIKLIKDFNNINNQRVFDKGFKKGYYSGQNDFKSLFNDYFIENPQAMKDIENWMKNEEKLF